MKRVCGESGRQFDISERDAAFYKRMGVPPPTLCPDERQRRRTAFRNERYLYKRKCDVTKKSIVSVYAPEFIGQVVSQEYWWGDQWDAEVYGREFDFNRPFFEQFHQLYLAVPQACSIVTNSINCEYNSYCTGGKNCYLCQRVGDSEDIFYCYLPIRSRDSLDSYNISDCELCYEVVDGENCYDVRFSQNVVNCNSSSFLFNCRNCSHCFFSTNLRNAEYYFENEKFSKEEYEDKISTYKVLTYTQLRELWLRFSALKASQIAPALWGNINENVSGNYIFESRNVYTGFDVKGAEDVSYAWGHIFGKDCMDTNFIYYGDECCELISNIKSNNLLYCNSIYNGSHDLFYSMHCVNNCHNLFGCIGLKHDEYCILNKQYSAEAYRTLREKIIEHMKNTGEWGEFFPITLSPFAYNETVAHEYLPLTREEVLAKGWRWRERDPGEHGTGNHASTLPEYIAEVSEGICEQLISCCECEKDYKIQKKEFQFYRKTGLPLPRYCPDCRYQRRVVLRNPRSLYQRTCDRCEKPIETSFAPDRPERVYCEECYVKEVN